MTHNAVPQRALEPTLRGGRNMNSVARALYYIRAVEDFLHDTIQLRYAFLSLDAISRRNPITGDRGRDHGRGHPNRDPYASDARLHPTIYDSCSSSAPGFRAARGANVPPARYDSRGALWLRADCDRLLQCVVGSRHRRAGPERLQI